MDEQDWLVDRFEEHRTHLKAVAYRMLGSVADAEDAVQESWLRVSRAGAGEVENLGAWLTTIVARVCLNMLRARKTARELDATRSARSVSGTDRADPEEEALLADSVGLALLVVLDRLVPAERLAFVMHDMFDLPFEEIAQVLGRSPAAARQLASRARRRVRGAVPASGRDRARQREVVEAFLTATRTGDFQGLMAVLDPEVVLRADPSAVPRGAETVLHGAPAVVAAARAYAGFARFTQIVLVNGGAGLLVAPRGRLMRVLTFRVVGGRIVGIDVIADPDRLPDLDLAMLGRAAGGAGS